MADINKTTPMEDLTIGGNIYEAVLDQYGLKKNVNNVVYVFLFAQKMQFLFVKIL